MEQLLAHLLGDYVLQSDWQANNKTQKSFACFVHVLLYGLPFLFLTFSPIALLVIVGSHFLIDRFRLAKYVIFIKNHIAPYSEIINPDCNGSLGEPCICKLRWENCKATGYPSETPAWLAVWLMIITDNLLHLTINYFALKYL